MASHNKIIELSEAKERLRRMGSGGGGSMDGRLARLEAAVDHIQIDLHRIHSRFDRIDERFNRIDEKFDRIDEKFDRKFDKIMWFIIATLVTSLAGLLKQFY